MKILQIIITFGLALATVGQVRPPPDSEWSQATAGIVGTDELSRTRAVEKVKSWIIGGWVSQDLWRKWLPALAKADKHQDIADLALLGALGRPGLDGIVPLMEFRVRALLALNKGDDALEAAKTYYNVCDIKLTGKAVELVELAFANEVTGAVNAEYFKDFYASFVKPTPFPIPNPASNLDDAAKKNHTRGYTVYAETANLYNLVANAPDSH